MVAWHERTSAGTVLRVVQKVYQRASAQLSLLIVILCNSLLGINHGVTVHT